MKLLKLLKSVFLRKEVFLTSLFVLVLFAPDSALAATIGEQTEQSIGATVQILIKTLNAVLWPFLLIIGDLMDNDIIIGPGMESRLRSIWVQIRDLVNIAFVLVLLVVAFYNVMGLGSEGNLGLKTALPKFVIGLILVNFTFLGGKVMLDITNLGTVAVFGLPNAVAQNEGSFNFDEQLGDFSREICVKTQATTDESGSPVPGSFWTAAEADDWPISTRLFCETDAGGNTTGELSQLVEARLFNDLNPSNIGVLMATNMGALESLALVKDDAVQNFDDLLINSLFALIMFIVFAVSYIVLGILLLTRVVVLWAAIALSPVAVLFYVVPQLSEAAGGGGDIQSKVVKHMIAPIIIGLAMTIGYIMIEAMSDVVGVASGLDSETVEGLFDNEFLLTGIADLQKFMIAITSIVVVWFGIFAAASGTYADTITDSIKTFGQDAAKLAAKAPSYLPIVPIRTKDGEPPSRFSAASIGQFTSSLPNLVEQKYGRGQADELAKLAGFDSRMQRLISDSQNISRQNYQESQRIMQDWLREGVPENGEAQFGQIMQRVLQQSGRSNPALERQIKSAAESGDVNELNRILQTEFTPEETGGRTLRAVAPVTEAAPGAPAGPPPTGPQVTFNADATNNITNALAAANIGTPDQQTAIAQAAQTAFTSTTGNFADAGAERTARLDAARTSIETAVTAQGGDQAAIDAAVQALNDAHPAT